MARAVDRGAGRGPPVHGGPRSRAAGCARRRGWSAAAAPWPRYSSSLWRCYGARGGVSRARACCVGHGESDARGDGSARRARQSGHARVARRRRRLRRSYVMRMEGERGREKMSGLPHLAAEVVQGPLPTETTWPRRLTAARSLVGVAMAAGAARASGGSVGALGLLGRRVGCGSAPYLRAQVILRARARAHDRETRRRRSSRRIRAGG